ncbi:GNAT family N-acetyltransferase [Cryptosporangium phraense]|uniref:GNAT family N-acetyltransferase n=1 Tax=Cryptosporangium phraense TaxID=2593070 RepID=A0A545ATX1_9ACTN|nr:GNAT family N-acetyltransferase [Cryptosporangium phraense]TQS44753.1 GNAT family N-acetyltransferase [Cryptosporangium phraense]
MIIPAVPGDAAELAALVNEVYAEAEEGLWPPGTPRTSVDEVASLITAGQLLVALAGGEIAGVVRVQLLDDRTGEFGMLAASRKHRGTGVGRELVAAAEEWARDAGRTTMQLEILVPHEWAHPSKEFLRAWYGRLGYRHERNEPLELTYPHLAPLLATPCDLTVWFKPL